ncbi:MAG: HEAT repeat domain-containing protein [Desulfobacterales bacterium]|nr:HEAT repeat domain-containing protein [Desulfobacterales bacterium]
MKNLKSLRDIHRATFPAAELLIGMGLAQAIATLQVYASNHRLFNQMATVAAAGFMPVPNPEVLPGLLSLGTAMAGGLLFTLSVGAGLAFLSTAAAWGWDGRAPRSRLAAAVPVGLQAALLLLMNSRGFDPWVSLYFIIIPPAVFWVTRRSLARRERPPDRWYVLWRVLPIVLLALAWSTQYDRSLFIDLRDHLLMSNTAGRSVSSFYYRYTLYPAELFKPLDQRLVRTVAWPDVDPPPPEVRQTLIRNDYLPVAAAGDADISLRMEGERMLFTRKGQTVLDTTTTRFLADPRRAMAEISTQTDRWPFFRTFTFYGVLLAFPMALYCLLFAGLRMLTGFVAGDRRADVLCAAACLLIGLGTLAFFHSSRPPPPRADEMIAALGSAFWQTRVAALRETRARQLDVCTHPAYTAMLRSPHPQERYWLARALATSPSPAASADLVLLLDDPHINVRTQAVEALAQRWDRGAVREILKRLQTSQDWYFQLYAYRALRTLGWNQTVSR